MLDMSPNYVDPVPLNATPDAPAPQPAAPAKPARSVLRQVAYAVMILLGIGTGLLFGLIGIIVLTGGGNMGC